MTVKNPADAVCGIFVCINFGKSSLSRTFVGLWIKLPKT